MHPFELTILGSSSATPASNRNPTAQLLNVDGRFFLIDCGEGTQMQLRRYKIKFQRIDHILISHLHGDHYLGLVGLLQSMHLLGREKELHLYCPKELKEIIDIQNKYSATKLTYSIIYHFTNGETSELLFEDNKLTIHTIILNHRIPCTGFIFREKPGDRKISIEKLEQYEVSIAEIHKLKKGLNGLDNHGKEISNELLTSPPPPTRSYAYCSETCYFEEIIDQIKEVDLLYHEATFLNNMLERAKMTFHSTALQAATIAKKAEVKRLLLGHFSARYPDLDGHLAEAREIFNNTLLAIEGEKISI
jgi:ribonuclease Z